MTNTELLTELATSVQALFVQRRGAFHPADFIAVAGLLGFEARPAATAPASPRPIASNYLPDLVGINLQHALATYAWGDWRPLSDDGVTISGFWDTAQVAAPPAGYVMAQDGRYLHRR